MMILGTRFPNSIYTNSRSSASAAATGTSTTTTTTTTTNPPNEFKKIYVTRTFYVILYQIPNILKNYLPTY